MSTYSLSHVSDAALARDLAAAAAHDRASTAVLLAHIAEFDSRKLYLPAAHHSMFSYCVRELQLSEDAAYKRIRAARTARQFPAIFAAVADGRLHVGAVVLLTPYLTPENAEELLAAAANESKGGIERLLAERFPRADLPDRVAAIAAATRPGPVGAPGLRELQLAPGPVEPPPSRPKVQPLAPERYGIQFTADQETYDLLGDAQALLGLPSGDLAQVFKRALKVLVRELEKRKFAATDRPHPRHQRASSNPRHVPARVKLAVWKRDQGQCTFKNEDGRRCPARAWLEFDHIEPVARGGTATVEGMRLRCRAHNQYAAECAFGAGFMERKREQARATAAAARHKPGCRARRSGTSLSGG